MLRRAFLAVVPPPDVLALDRIGGRFGTPNRRGEPRRPALDPSRPAPPHAAVPRPRRRIGRRFAHRIGRRIGPTDRALHGRARRWRCLPVGAACVGRVARRVEWRRRARCAGGHDHPGDRAARVRCRRPSVTEPHLTLARVNSARDVRPVVEHLGTGPAGPPFTVDRVVLFDSDTRSDGAVHTERNRFVFRRTRD